MEGIWVVEELGEECYYQYVAFATEAEANEYLKSKRFICGKPYVKFYKFGEEFC